jgi:hypothetical protein
MSALRGYSLRQIFTYKGVGAAAQQVVNVGKALPATATGNVFTVTGSVVVTSLVGVVSTALGAVATHISNGTTGSPASIAANPTAAYATVAVGGVIQMPDKIGDPLPAPVTASGLAAAIGEMELTNTSITITTDATDTGAITWLLTYVPLIRKIPGSVAAV